MSQGVIKVFFQRIQDLRIDMDKTQEDIAKLLNCKREVYRRYEKGIYEIPVWAIIKLADYYETSVDYLTGRTDNPIPYESKRIKYKERRVTRRNGVLR